MRLLRGKTDNFAPYDRCHPLRTSIAWGSVSRQPAHRYRLSVLFALLFHRPILHDEDDGDVDHNSEATIVHIRTTLLPWISSAPPPCPQFPIVERQSMTACCCNRQRNRRQQSSRCTSKKQQRRCNQALPCREVCVSAWLAYWPKLRQSVWRSRASRKRNSPKVELFLISRVEISMQEYSRKLLCVCGAPILNLSGRGQSSHPNTVGRADQNMGGGQILLFTAFPVWIDRRHGGREVNGRDRSSIIIEENSSETVARERTET